MRFWPWILLLGLLFLITYDPRSGNLAKYYSVPIGEDGKNPADSTNETPGKA